MRDVTVNLDVAKEVQIGKAVKATGTVKNASNKKRTINAHLTAILIHYTGQAAKQLKDVKSTFSVGPGEGDAIYRLQKFLNFPANNALRWLLRSLYIHPLLYVPDK